MWNLAFKYRAHINTKRNEIIMKFCYTLFSGILFINTLSANPIKWSNTLKQLVENLPTNSLSVFDYFMWLALKRLTHLLSISLLLRCFSTYWNKYCRILEIIEIKGNTAQKWVGKGLKSSNFIYLKRWMQKMDSINHKRETNKRCSIEKT